MYKKILLPILILCQLQLVAQQFYNRAYHAVNEKPGPFVLPLHNDFYFTSMNYDAGSLFGTCYLYKHNAAGTLVFKKNIWPGYEPDKAIPTKDGALLMAGHPVICDVMGTTQENSIIKLDTAGNPVFTSTFAVAVGDYPKALVQAQDSSYYVFTDSLLFHHAKNGQFISKLNLGVQSVSSALLRPNNSLLVSAMFNGSPVIIEDNLSWNSNNMFPFAVLLKKMELFGGAAAAAMGEDGKLYTISANALSVQTSAFGGGCLVNDFVCSNDTMYALCATTASSACYLLADDLLNMISLSSTSTSSISQQAICIKDNRALILSAGTSKSSYSFPQHYFVSLSAINKYGDHNFTSDIALLKVEADSSYITCNTVGIPPQTQLCNSYFRPRFTVKNTGSIPVNKFKLNCFEYANVACGGHFYQEAFSGFSLAPGDSMIFTATAFAKNYEESVSSTSVDLQYCFYTTLPNGETDKTLEDNELCKNISFLLSSLSDLQVESVQMALYPNPFNGLLTISANNSITEIRFMNMLGAVVAEIYVNSKEAQLDLAQLPAGIYLIKAKTEKGILTKKVIKQ